MKATYLIIITYFFNLNLSAQKDSNGHYLCQADSLMRTFEKELVENGVDAIFIFDCKGREDNSKPFVHVFWSKDSVGYLRQFGGCDKIKADNTYKSNESLEFLSLYKDYQMDTIESRRIKGSLGLYHAQSCFVYVLTPGKTRKFGYQLPTLNWIIEQAENLEETPNDSIDPRTLIIKRFEKIRNTNYH